MARFTKNISASDHGEPSFIKVIDGVSRILSLGKKPKDTDPYDPGSASSTDLESFLRFLAEYGKELRKGD